MTNPMTNPMAGPMAGPGAHAAICALADELHHCHGLQRLYARGSGPIAVLSVCAGVTVWCDGRVLRCHLPAGLLTWPASDPHGAAARLAPLAAAEPRPGPDAGAEKGRQGQLPASPAAPSFRDRGAIQG